jgi:muramoyltetrapeptide carboxypeptidase
MSTLIKPAYLQPGDIITIVAPAGVVVKEDIDKAKSIFESWDLQVRYGKNLFKQQGQFSGTDQQRLEDLQEALDDEHVKAVVCARGGYGTIRIIDKIDWSHFVNKPKWVLGYSDITILHAKIHNLGFESIHCPMPVNMAKYSENDPILTQIREVLFFGQLNYANLFHQLNRNGFGRAKIIGGNLSILHSLLGTKYDMDYQGKFLFIEDVGEQLYKIDRMLHSFKLGGKFDELEGMLVGGFTEIEDGKRPFGKSAQEIIYDVTADFNFPVAFGLPIGHQKNNHPLILGAEIKIEIARQQAKIKFL